MIKNIIFDLSEVYLGGMYGLERKISKLTGSKVPDDYLYLQNELQDFFNGKITENILWESLIERHGWKIDASTLQEIVRSQMVEIKGTRKIIEKLNQNGYKLGLLSVHGREWIEYCEKKFDYHGLFHSIMYSYEVGVCKPEKKAFELILEKLDANPSECLFIDDYYVNTKAAEDLGIKSIVFEDAVQLKKELRKLKIAV